MEHASHMATLSEGESLKIDEELMARRLKNRERQRRYRAKKRFEADMRKSYVTQQQAMWPLEPQIHGVLDNSEVSGSSAQREAQANNPSACFVARVHSGRKWKKDARLSCQSQGLERQSTAKPLSEVDANPERLTNSTIRRDWKADARNKIDVVACESIH